MRIGTIGTFVVKTSGTTTSVFLTLDVTFRDSKSGLKIRSCTFILVSTILTRNNVNNIRAVTRQATSNSVHSICNLTLKFTIRYKITLADVTFIITFIRLRLRRICDDDVTFGKRSSEHQNYLIVRELKPSSVKQPFSEVRNKTTVEARTKQEIKKQGK